MRLSRSTGAVRTARLAGLLGLGLLGVACSIDTIPRGARATPPGDGPKIVFDLTHRPLPNIPVPNDVATFPDPSSRTGRRLNVSTSVPTRLERVAREGFDDLEGWGTFQPITVAFENPDPYRVQPAIALDDVRARMTGHDFGDDPLYVIDLHTGLPVPLDVGGGAFPVTSVDPDKYWPNDPHEGDNNILFETRSEGAGPYRPDLDLDQDGVLDRANTLPTTAAGAISGIDDVLTWYERQTDTLIVRPLVPLREKTEYAVVLTDRLRDPRGGSVRSPFESIHHAEHLRQAERVGAILRAGRKEYFGDLAGTSLDHVAFTWSFTTGPVSEDLVILRDGLHGRGPFARLATEFPPKATVMRAVGLARDRDADVEGWQDDARCKPKKDAPYIVRLDGSRDAFRQLVEQVAGLEGEEQRALLDSLENVDYLVLGTYDSPYFMGDAKNEDPDGRFLLNFKTGEGRVSRDTVPFLISVPKKKPGRAPPFPTAMWSHGTGLSTAEILVRAGYFAKQGVAMFAIDLPGHGLALDTGQVALAAGALTGVCLVPMVNALQVGRHHDLNGDGLPDSGGHIWTAHAFHSRDNIRQGVIDLVQGTRLLRSFGDATRGDDYTGDGRPELLGDFDGDGVVDLGGPAPIYTSGNSLGGIMAMIHGAVDPNVKAAAPISGGGGLTDIAARSRLTPDPVLLQAMSPILVSLPASTRKDKTRCAEADASVRMIVVDLDKAVEIEVACLPKAELDEGMTVLVRNLRTKEVRCGRTEKGVRFRVPIAADIGDRLDVQVYAKKDAVDSYKDCNVVADAGPGRRIRTFEQRATKFGPVADGRPTCGETTARAGLEGEPGCQQFQGRFYPVGSPLVAVQEGLGLLRQSPELRQLMSLLQAALDPGDPINFARSYALEPLPGLDGAPMPPRGIITFDTAGDFLVPTGTGIAFARVAGALPFFPPSAVVRYPEYAAYATPPALYEALGGRTPHDAILAYHVTEGLSRTKRTRGGPACAANYVKSAVCTSPPSAAAACATALPDVDWLAEGADRWDQVRPERPLRLVRTATRGTDPAALDAAWAPRTRTPPFSPDADGYRGTAPLVGLVHAYNEPGGTHVWVNGDPCKAFDDAVYYNHLLIRFLASGGTDAYFASHPGSHRCLATQSCNFLR